MKGKERKGKVYYIAFKFYFHKNGHMVIVILRGYGGTLIGWLLFG